MGQLGNTMIREGRSNILCASLYDTQLERDDSASQSREKFTAGSPRYRSIATRLLNNLKLFQNFPLPFLPAVLIALPFVRQSLLEDLPRYAGVVTVLARLECESALP